MATSGFQIYQTWYSPNFFFKIFLLDKVNFVMQFFCVVIILLYFNSLYRTITLFYQPDYTALSHYKQHWYNITKINLTYVIKNVYIRKNWRNTEHCSLRFFLTLHVCVILNLRQQLCAWDIFLLSGLLLPIIYKLKWPEYLLDGKLFGRYLDYDVILFIVSMYLFTLV